MVELESVFQTQSATNNNLRPCRLSTYGTRAFSVSGPVCWNALPDKSHLLIWPFFCFRQVKSIFIL